MTEALGIAASIAGLASLTIQITQISFQYVSDITSASKCQADYLQELSALTSVLLRLQQATSDPDISHLLASRDDTISTDAINNCNKQLEHVKSKLEKRSVALAEPGPFSKLKLLGWPFEEKETKKLVATLHRFHDIFLSALATDHL
jgi:hypothetical protein